jgi:hypothetical protein
VRHALRVMHRRVYDEFIRVDDEVGGFGFDH